MSMSRWLCVKCHKHEFKLSMDVHVKMAMCQVQAVNGCPCQDGYVSQWMSMSRWLCVKFKLSMDVHVKMAMCQCHKQKSNNGCPFKLLLSFQALWISCVYTQLNQNTYTQSRQNTYTQSRQNTTQT
jgi:hypothetical protein